MDLKLKNEVRAFELKQFRNIGYGDNSEENSTLILNYSLNPEYMGDLVILIGPNNSGKSNVLDALSCFAKRNILKRDYSDTRLNDENPTLKLFASCKRNKTNEIVYKYELNKDNKLQFKEGSKIEKEPILNLDKYIDIVINSNHENFSNDLMIIEDLLKKYNLEIYQPKFEYGINSYVLFDETKLNHREIKNNLIELEKLMRSIIANSKINLLKLRNFYDEIRKNCGSYINAFLEECNNYIRLTNNDK
ncbi:AAA family ATPase [bacterium]|nr:AAA family ATPase [bacterium]